MMITTDFHLHTNLSVDCPTPIESMIRGAIARGFTEIAFTDHVDHNPADEGAGLYDPIRAYEIFTAARRQFDGQITLRYGAELSEPHLYTRENETFYRIGPDVVIGSIHCLGPHGIHSDYFDQKPVTEGIRGYFDFMLDMVRYSDLDVIGHLDYFDRYTARRNFAPYDPRDYQSLITAILETLIVRSIALEINTSGYRLPNPRPFPHPRVIEWYHRMGGRLISIGSDAHRVDELACGFEPTLAMLRDLGFREYQIHRNRKPVSLPLP